MARSKKVNNKITSLDFYFYSRVYIPKPLEDAVSELS
jgi:hypothetical protein